MIDYLRGGLQINLVIGIDFTGSNGNPEKIGTLHYGAGSVRNAYIDAITGVGNILIPYDSDRLIPCFGFGARPSPNVPVSHCFAMNGNDQKPDCLDLAGVLAAYRSVFERRVVLSGPTYFEQVIRMATEIANEPTLPNKLTYTVLLIITDGIIDDLQQTVNAICDAAKVPLSIICVGVGNANFQKMELLDADIQPLVNSKGEQSVRDIVQFVPFNKVSGDGSLLAKETLAELPHQIEEYFELSAIVPGLPIEVSTGNFYEEEIPTRGASEIIHMAEVVNSTNDRDQGQIGKKIFNQALGSGFLKLIFNVLYRYQN